VIYRLRLNFAVIGRCLSILSKSDRRKVFYLSIVQVSMGLLDLLGVAAVGILGALTITGVQSRQPGNRVSAVLTNLHLDQFTFQQQAAFLGVLAAMLLVTRTVLSIYFTKKVLYFLSAKSAELSSALLLRVLSQSLTDLQKRSSQEILHAVSSGINTVLIGVIGSLSSIIADGSIFLVLILGLVVVDAKVAIATFTVFLFVGIFLDRYLSGTVRMLGMENTKLSIETSGKILEVLTSYRESFVRNRRYYYADEIKKLNFKHARIISDLQFIPNISKYVIETTVVLGALLVSGIQFALADASRAIATLAVFLAAGTRLAPALLRLQQATLSIKASLGSATQTLELISELEGIQALSPTENIIDFSHEGFTPAVSIKNITFGYPSNNQKVIKELNLEIEPGSVVAIVGPSGAGKTTLVDILLGLLQPNDGEVTISSMEPALAISKFPGAISYVPQDSLIVSGTVAENVTLGYPIENVDYDKVENALRDARLDFSRATGSSKLNVEVGERGSKLSGGQRQRLGIARALYSQPKLLILDEATSALDGKTEFEISDSFQTLKGKTTVIIIAHRLSTIRNVDKVHYIDGGRLVASGSFEKVRELVPDFDIQAKMMGL